jgi:hypothetical protein
VKFFLQLLFEEESLSSIIDDVFDAILFIFVIFNVFIFFEFSKVAEQLFISFSSEFIMFSVNKFLEKHFFSLFF